MSGHDVSVGAGTHAIRWVPKSIGWRSADWLYSVGPTYTVQGEKWRACFHAQANNVRALGEIRDTPALAKLDAQAEADRIAREDT
jgi:hypothetical protein